MFGERHACTAIRSRSMNVFSKSRQLCFKNAVRFRRKLLMGERVAVIQTHARGGLASCGEH